MGRVLRAVARLFPPAFVLFLFVDLLMNPNIPRLGSTTVSAGEAGKLSANASRELLERTRKLVREGKDQQALEPALKLYNAWPENYLYIRTLAEIYQRLDRPKEEAEFWEKFLQYAPLPDEACPDIGKAYWRQKRWDEAINAYQRCLSIDPDVIDSIFFLAHAYELRGNYDRAGAIYREGVAKRPHNSDCRIGLARVEMRTGRVSAAKKRILEVLADSPNNVDALLVAGIVYYLEGDNKRAREYLLQGSARTNGYADYYVMLGRVAESEGHAAEARTRYAHALELQPDYEDAARRLRALGGARP
ncbi:MAG TPA: tetratricopeptide repeat protein [Bryobacteraceae bacterium]|jgi:tetratricopeptide (TPR) repeat protein